MDFQTAIVSRHGSIYFAYVDDNLQAIIAKKAPNGAITTSIITTGIKADPHNSPSIGIDAEGYIHWAGNMHNDPMRYFRSTLPYDITSFVQLNGDTLNGGMYGVNGVSYGRFILSRRGTLMFISRQRVSTVADGWVPGGQSGHIQVYNPDTKKWIERGGLNYSFLSDKGITISGGMDSKHQVKAVFWDNSGAGPLPNNGYQGYKIRVVFDKNNRMHMAWTVAKNPVYSRDNNDVANAHTHLMYAFSDDEGITWRRTDGIGGNLVLPITTETGELIYTEDPSVNTIRMFNGAFVTFDGSNFPCVMAWSGSNGRIMVFRNVAPGVWIDAGFLWNNGWPGEAASDDNGWITILNQNRWRRSNDKGITWQQYERDNSYRGHAGQSIDYDFLYETGGLRFKTESGNIQTIRTIVGSEAREGQVMAPAILPLSGSVFTTPTQQVTITNQTAGAEIRYTIDGSFPSSTSLLYSGPFEVSSTTIVKARAFIGGRVSSQLSVSHIRKFVSDNEPPSKPLLLSASNIKPFNFDVNWANSTDNIQLMGYEVYLNNIKVGTTLVPSYSFSSLSPLTEYTVKVRAYDGQNNFSAFSENLKVITPSSIAAIHRKSGNIAIDGVKEAGWDGITYDFDQINAGSIADFNDLSGTWIAVYDDEFLYFYVDVNDNELSFNRPNWYENDGIEVYIDATNRKGSSYQSTDFQFNYMISDNQLRERNRNISTSGTELHYSSKPGGYKVEFKIPLSLLGILNPQAGYIIGLDLMIIDNDNNNWQGKRSWFNLADNSWNNPSAFGQAIFANLLPLKLIEFNGRWINNAVTLNWSTEQEEGFKEFEVHRSIDGSNYKKVGKIRGGEFSYRFLDSNLPFSNYIFYKLKMLDVDGSFKWSRIIRIENSFLPQYEIKFTNPFYDKITVSFGLDADISQIKIIDIFGRDMRNIPVQGISTINCDVSNLLPGTYYLVVLTKNGKLLKMEKIMKM
jgi:hypothetical protein